MLGSAAGGTQNHPCVRPASSAHGIRITQFTILVMLMLAGPLTIGELLTNSASNVQPCLATLPSWKRGVDHYQAG